MSLKLALLAAAATSAVLGSGAKAEEENVEILTVYGTSNPLPVFDYPGQVSVVTREDVELFAPSAVSDLLRDLPGVEFSGGPRRTGETPSIRGFGGENVLILLDGARQSFISAHDGRFFVDPDLLRSAELVRGPASALYGSGAIGGVLALETVDAADLLEDGETIGARLRGGYQDVNAETHAALTGFGQLGALDVVGSFGIRDSGDIRLGSGVDLASDDDIQTALVKGSIDFDNAFDLEASWTRFQNDAFEPNNGQGVILPTSSTLAADVNKDITSDNWRFSAGFNPESLSWVDTSLVIYRSETDVEEEDPSVPRNTLRDIETTGITLRNTSQFSFEGADLTLTVGGDWYKDEQVGTDSTSTDGTRDGVPDGSAEFYGVFAQLEAKVTEPLGLPGDVIVIPGVRFDSFESSAVGEPEENSDDATSLRFAASYGPTEWFRFFGSFSEAFRAPSINELYLDGVHFPLAHPSFPPPAFVPAFNSFVSNADLIPEESETIEFGLGVDFADLFVGGDSFQAKASYHSSKVDNLIDIVVRGEDGLPIQTPALPGTFSPTCFVPPFFPCSAGATESRNVTDAELDGIELEGVYETDRFRGKVTFSSIDGEDTATGADLGTLTPDRLNFDFRFKLPAWHASVGTRIQLAEEFTRTEFSSGALVTTEQRDEYAVIDLYATWAPAAINGLRIDAGVDNVFDEDYERVFAGVSEPGVNGRIALSYRFGQ